MMAEMHKSKQTNKIGGTHAVLGMDMVAFSKFHDDDQIQAIECLIRWISEALAYHSITEKEYRWSPAGDGGYLTFATPSACRKAIDVAFSICEKIQRPDWVPRTGEKIQLRFGLHAGTVREARELGRKTNIWGLGINTAARILSVAAASQVLVSKQYYDTYIKGQRDKEFESTEVHWRTVKHGVQLEVMNISRHNLGLPMSAAIAQRWQSIGGLWKRTITEYKFLIHDAMKSSEPVAALAAAKFLLQLNARDDVRDLAYMIGKTDERPDPGYPPQVHQLFSLMPPEILLLVLEQATPRLFNAGDVICERGDPAKTSFFLVSGTILVDVPSVLDPIRIPTGQIIGEFSFWIPNLRRTARLRAADDGLLLEMAADRFKSILNDAPHVAEAVYGIIKQRIVENIVRSHQLFPDVSGERKASILASCGKYDPGSQLDLTSSAYVLFNGRVEIEPPQGSPLQLEARGDFANVEIVGIVSEAGLPDGPKATTMEETVAVMIPHDTLRKLQTDFEQVRTRWNEIFGKRLGAIRRRPPA